MSQRNRGNVLFASLLLAFGLLGFASGGASARGLCEDEACSSLGDCSIKAGYDCDEEPVCTDSACKQG